MSSTTILYIIISGIIALLIALFQYRSNSKKALKENGIFLFLRFLSLCAIFILLINPQFEKVDYYDEKPKLVVCVDNSSSVQHLGHTDAVIQLVEQLKTNNALDQKFDLDFYAFGNDLSSLDSLDFSESQSNLDVVFRELNQVLKANNAPVIFISDGNQTIGNDYTYSSGRLDQPIFPVILGDTTTYTDLQLKQLNVNRYAYLKNKLPVEAIITYNGYSNVTTRFDVRKADQVVYSESLSFDKTNNSRILNFNLPADRVGIQTYKAVVRSIANERNVVNNSKNFAVEIIDQKTKVALISNIAHPDVGAIRKSIESNEQRQVSILTPQEFIARKDEFQLAILYQPNNTFRAVYELLNSESANRFVICGTKTDYGFINAISKNYRVDITNQSEDFLGVLNPNYGAFIVDDLNFESFPPLRSTFGNFNFKVPYESILNKRVGRVDMNEPLLSTFESDSRREALLIGEDLWKWRAQSFLNQQSFNEFDNFLGKLIQYLASDQRKDRLNVEYESFYQGHNNIVIKAQFFNKNYEFDNKASLTLNIRNSGAQNTTVLPFLLKGSHYQVDLSHLPAGEYSFTVKSSKENISRSGRFQILEYNIEQQFLNADVSKLQFMAQNTGGTSYFIDSYSSLFDDLIDDKRFATIQRSNRTIVPLIDWKYLLLILILSLASEWFLRKYKGLI